MDIEPFPAFHAVEPILPKQPSFISLIPNEVLLDIFAIAIVPSISNAVSCVLPFRLSHVSKLWRALTLGFPTLWTNISIHETLSLTSFKYHKLPRVAKFLERSGTLALTIDIWVVSHPISFEELFSKAWPDDDLDDYHQCLENLSLILAPHVWRFRSLSIVCSDFSDIAYIQRSFPAVPMPQLEFWSVRQTCGSGLAFEDNLVDMGDMTALRIPLHPPKDVTHDMNPLMFPRLRSAIFDATPMEWSRFCPRNLHYLEIDFLPTQARPSGDVLRHILLENEHSLVSLKIYGASPLSKASQPYEMSNLERLDIGYAFPEELLPFVGDIKLPNLVHLVIEDISRSSSPDFLRQELDYNHGTTVLFQNITEQFPLRQVKDLELRHIYLMPPLPGHTPSHAQFELVRNQLHLIIPYTPFQFFCKLVELKNLTLVNPDIATISTLNHIPTQVHVEAASNLNPALVPVPALDVIHLEDFDRDLIRLFLFLRASEFRAFRRFSMLTFGNPCGVDPSARWIESIAASGDMFLVTEDFVYNEPNIFNDVEVEATFGECSIPPLLDISNGVAAYRDVT